MDQRHGQPFVNVALKGLPFEGDTILGSLGFQRGLGALGILLVVLGSERLSPAEALGCVTKPPPGGSGTLLKSPGRHSTGSPEHRKAKLAATRKCE